MTEEEILALPLSAIVDGWTVERDGKKYVYLFVRVPGGQQTVLIERSAY